MAVADVGTRFLRRTLKGALASAGLLPAATGALHAYKHVRYLCAGRFLTRIRGQEVVFVTEDRRSKKFFHHRYRPGQLHEPPVAEALADRLQGAVAFADVGAHIGYYACIAGVLNRNLQLFAFEMNRNLVGVIERNLAANRILHAEVVNKAVADRAKTVAYTAQSTDPGLVMRDAGTTLSADADTATIEAVALDDFFADRGIVPDVIKIDVQGAELQVLEGARRIIAAHRPVLFVEIHPTLLPAFATGAAEVHAVLRGHGYRLALLSAHRHKQDALATLEPGAAIPATTHMLVCT